MMTVTAETTDQRWVIGYARTIEEAKRIIRDEKKENKTLAQYDTNSFRYSITDGIIRYL